ncbi:MAG: NTP transferase domain-containing protein [Acetobacteraceae bacterium]|nr:NTP transferase domain-containing protein [Acetobacteraceae bacterium]
MSDGGILQVLMPMAGRGTRFAAAAPNVPKPLIPVGGSPMFRHALESLASVKGALEVVAVAQECDLRERHMAAELAAACPGIRIVSLQRVTRGAVETCLHAENRLVGSRALMVLDCDLRFTAPAFLELAGRAAQGRASFDAALLCFRSRDSRYSFAELEGSRVLRTAEKRPISDAAICGAYLFRSANCFFDAARRLMRKPPFPEYYVSGVLNELLALEARVTAVMAERVLSFGTPEELEHSAPLVPLLKAA